MTQTMSSTSLSQFRSTKPSGNLGLWFAKRVKAVAVWRQNQMDIRVLASMDDRLLRDIGLTRGEIWGLGRHF